MSPQPKWHFDQFSRFCADDHSVSLYFTVGRPQTAPSHRGSGPHLIHGSLWPGPTQVLNPNSVSIGSAVFAGLTSVTDRPHYFVGNNRLYLHTVMQLKTVDIVINFLSKFSEKKIFLKCEII